jgi:hypothetical protein
MPWKKRVRTLLRLTKDVRNPKPDGRMSATFADKVLHKGTLFVKETNRFGSYSLTVHPSSYKHQDDGWRTIFNYKTEDEPTIKAIEEASMQVPWTIDLWAQETYTIDKVARQPAAILGKVLEAVLADQGNIPRLLGIDNELDNILKALLAGKPFEDIL